MKPETAGTTAGTGVFFQSFMGAVFSQIYGLLADGTPKPLVITASAAAVLALLAGLTPVVLKFRERLAPLSG
ncbi:MAG: hypothetical protein HY661_14720 [Betaproteobacteria bacterium]|nr:hypothetical protein [Betaproteobacteria bacterium]